MGIANLISDKEREKIDKLRGDIVYRTHTTPTTRTCARLGRKPLRETAVRQPGHGRGRPFRPGIPRAASDWRRPDTTRSRRKPLRETEVRLPVTVGLSGRESLEPASDWRRPDTGGDPDFVLLHQVRVKSAACLGRSLSRSSDCDLTEARRCISLPRPALATQVWVATAVTPCRPPAAAPQGLRR